MRSSLVLACLGVVACGPAQPTCSDVGAREAEASAPERHLLGAASAYPADPTLEARFEELASSQRARRAEAWAAVARVLAPVALSEPTPLGHARVPRWRTFYDREDFARLFSHLYAGLSPDERARNAPLGSAQVDGAFVWNAGFIDELGTWPQERWDAYLAGFDSQQAVNTLGGIQRIAMSPAMTRHLMTSYAEILRCLDEGPPPSELAGEPRRDELARAPVMLEACGEARFGPFFVARGGSLRAVLEPAQGARVSLLEGPSLGDATLACEAEGECVAQGPGLFHVRITASEDVRATLAVERTEVAAPVACLRGALPLDAVSVAAEWRRLDPAHPLPTYDTSAAALAARMHGEAPAWGEGDGRATPGPDAIYTQRLPSGAVFVLAGLHVRTRELPLGLNITLWWSDRPDEDFGADRPEAVRALGGPWSHYKMCVAVEHVELDPDPRGGFGDDAPSLGASLAAVHEGRGGPTWCSNPYIDAAPGLAVGNCVGCHQHAMSGVRPGEIATDTARFPSNGRLSARNNYPADGTWALDAGDELAWRIHEIVDYWQ